MTTQPADAFVFFGATGDLAARKIIPALLALVRRGRLAVPVVGVAMENWDGARFTGHARAALDRQGAVDEAAFQRLASLFRYIGGDYRDPATFAALRAALGGARRPLHYLAIPPSMFEPVLAGLSASGCTAGARVVVEKPFGRDLASARELGARLAPIFPESAVYRIDHFLGKEPVQNIFYTRFANAIFEPIWNRDHIAAVQITMAEDFGVEGRGAFYEEAGAVRDVLQNHLLAMVAHLAMDPPSGSSVEALRDEATRLLRAARPIAPADVVRGQFRGYRDERGVAPGSQIETFVAVRLFIDSWRWEGVPFLIRAGKRLPVTSTTVTVEFKRPPRETFGETVPISSNHLRLRLSPEVLIGLGVRVKVPSERMEGKDVELIVCQNEGDALAPYERLLGDALAGDQTLFGTQARVEEQWRVVEPLLRGGAPPTIYEPGSWGPPEAGALVPPGTAWHDPRASERGRCAPGAGEDADARPGANAP